MVARRARWRLGLYGITVSLMAAAAGPAEPATSPTAQPPATTQPTTQALPPLEGFRTVETAIAAKVKPSAAPEATPQVGYLGVAAGMGEAGKLVVQHVDPVSPAAGAGFKEGDVLVRAGNDPVVRPEALQEWLLGHASGDTVKLTILRDGKERDLSAQLAPASRPMKAGARRVVLGVQLRDVPADKAEGAHVDQVTAGMPADKAGIKEGDVIAEVDGVPIASRQALTEALLGRSPGDEVKVGVKRGGKLLELHVKLAADPSDTGGGGGFGRGRRGGGGGGFPDGGPGGPGDRPERTFADRGANTFRKDVYHLAVVGIEFPDHKHNNAITTKDWEDSFFTKGTYNNKNVTGQTVYGSLNDFYLEDSAGAFHVEGKMFDWVEVAKNRADYGQGTGDNQRMLPEALDKLLERDGRDALKDFDGIAFIYAGERVPTNRGGLFWPHKGLFNHNNKRWNYLIVNEGGAKMTNISVFCHEFGHMLGLPDLYARPENPGSEGLGSWCLMSQQLPNGRPQHMSAWCKEQLGWLKPTVIDPTVQQRLVLSPVENSSRECFKVLIRPDGSEYLLLENRRRTGFDADLMGEGLLIWHVIAGRPFLVESHGIGGPAGPRSFVQAVPFPSAANHAFTPYTTPSSRSVLGGGLPVYVTEIERRADGRITFAVGYQYF